MNKKYKLKPISFHGHKPEEVLKAFMRVDPKKVEKQFKKESGKNNPGKEAHPDEKSH